MDCGEGTLNQMLKFFGGEETDRQLIKIKVVFLTHIHLDHHGGMYGMVGSINHMLYLWQYFNLL